MTVEVHPLTPDRWDDLEQLFTSASATRNCWCMWWRIAGNAWRDTDRPGRRASFRALVEDGPPPGLIAYRDGTPAGWVQITPRTAIPRFNNGRTSKPEKDADLDAVWAISCFFTAKSARKSGLMETIAGAACDFAAKNGAASVEAAAFRPKRELQWSEGYVGLEGPLRRAGFEPVAQRSEHRVLMRWIPK